MGIHARRGLAVAVAAALCALRMLPRERMPEVDNLSTAREAEFVGGTLYFCGCRRGCLQRYPLVGECMACLS